MSNPNWITHRIGAARDRKLWRLTPGSEIRSGRVPASWGRVDRVRTAVAGAPFQPVLTVQVQVSAVLDCADGLPRMHREMNTLPHRSTAWTQVRTRKLDRRLR